MWFAVISVDRSWVRLTATMFAVGVVCDCELREEKSLGDEERNFFLYSSESLP